MGYVMGKSEARNNKSSDWHGHVTAISVGEEHRRLGVAGKLMQFLEDVSERKKCYFVDLFVRVSNVVAVAMYKKMGYVVYRTMSDYYTGMSNEDAYDMRRALSWDVDKISEREPTQEEIAELEDTWEAITESNNSCICTIIEFCTIQ